MHDEQACPDSVLVWKPFRFPTNSDYENAGGMRSGVRLGMKPLPVMKEF